MPSEMFPTPFPVKLDRETLKGVEKLKRKSGLNRTAILRRAVRFAVPKFLSGEASIMDAGGEREKP